MQDSLPAGGLRLCRAGVEPAGSLREVSDHLIPLPRAFPGAITVRRSRGAVRFTHEIRPVAEGFPASAVVHPRRPPKLARLRRTVTECRSIRHTIRTPARPHLASIFRPTSLLHQRPDHSHPRTPIRSVIGPIVTRYAMSIASAPRSATAVRLGQRPFGGDVPLARRPRFRFRPRREGTA